MKRKLLLSLSGALCLFALPALAQDDAPTSKPNAISSYKTAIGLRFSPSYRFRPDVTVTAKHFISPEFAVEAQAGTADYDKGYHASLQYVWQPQLLTSQRLRPYAGIGLGVTGTEVSRYREEQPLSTNLIGIGSIGLEYSFAKVPISLSVDYRHALFGYKTDSFKDMPINRINNVAVGLKYNFR
ncbi:outer membrane beta-barrel protein [Pontibacter cellulosilyticus]|uniref:Outer membrane beta-barrel protein n=1 Tax=Pontibacter cellulosilyticus TaxID=1720253 RepID=A0A923NC51_9BACT|nr:outer membrane beta-barrel protein [Pontibacter cellulosilyticus]MBC5994220.1 outer membrane beta-barrel protein [Pontibacter cellulosilyticus]